ncbi:hypothetical protein L873DRAFT_1825208 [Choiromyces venosus 120613-1]|uniref:Xylanolytic transcriptional activator regulatory domain-containing protein n=1 Tax=Choiromyces venosus 120613-1 TaxID=1336337 RepID=A0A3N4K4I9_9PEZI|nr:hypothetical protein L873DRAFT_1825208 [Choiromyces venosus 120613-1]
MIMLKKRVEIYETLLDQLKNQVDSAGQLAIQKALQEVGVCFNKVISPEREKYRSTVKNRDGESLVTADVGSTGSVDHIRQDPNPADNTYPTGYMGKNSEVAWIQRVAQQLASEAYKTHATKDDEDYQFETPTYHLDDLSVSIAGGDINPFYLPPKDVADQLLNAFFETVYPTFPIVLKGLFMAQYDAFFQCFFPPGSSKRWLAMLNLMFAIGALYGRLIDAEWKGESELEHLRYFARARVLSLDESSMFEVPDLQQVQVVSLAGIYLIASNQTNRAWNVVGLAVRYAQTLGLNLRNDVPEFDEVEKEMRVRMWYTLYSLDHLLCTMTGRPACIQNKDCSVPMPRPIEQEQYFSEEAFGSALRRYSQIMAPPSPSPNTARATATTNGQGSSIPLHIPSIIPEYPATYFIEHTKLNQIISEALAQLYRPATKGRSWSDIQGIISALELRIMKWRADLPLLLDFGKRHRDQIYCRQRMALAFQYQYIRIIINRPCLCRLDYRIPNESKRSRGFNRSAAATCIEAAREMIALLPDEPNPIGLISTSPWWCLLHYLVSAGTVLMVEIAMRAEHNPQQADGLLKDSKKVVSWLRAMGKDNLGAERSWTVLSKLLIVAAPKIGGDTSDVRRDFPPSKRRNKDGKTYSRANDKVSESPRGTGGGREGEGDHGHHHHQEQSHNNMGGQMEDNQEQPLEDFPDIFRGLLTDPFPFAGIPIPANFDNPIAMQEAPPHYMQQNHNRTNFTPNRDNGPDMMQTPHTSMMFPTPEQLQSLTVSAKEVEEEEAHKQQEKRQRRKQLQGVGQISLPPPFPPHWVPSSPMHSLPQSHSQGSGEPFSMGGLAHSFRDSGHGSQTTRGSYEDISSAGNNAGQRRAG